MKPTPQMQPEAAVELRLKYSHSYFRPDAPGASDGGGPEFMAFFWGGYIFTGERTIVFVNVPAMFPLQFWSLHARAIFLFIFGSKFV